METLGLFICIFLIALLLCYRRYKFEDYKLALGHSFLAGILFMEIINILLELC